jgi:hypothetical protein
MNHENDCLSVPRVNGLCGCLLRGLLRKGAFVALFLSTIIVAFGQSDRGFDHRHCHGPAGRWHCRGCR